MLSLVIMKVHNQGLANGMTLNCLVKTRIIAAGLSVVSSEGMKVITITAPKSQAVVIRH